MKKVLPIKLPFWEDVDGDLHHNDEPISEASPMPRFPESVKHARGHEFGALYVTPEALEALTDYQFLGWRRKLNVDDLVETAAKTAEDVAAHDEPPEVAARIRDTLFGEPDAPMTAIEDGAIELTETVRETLRHGLRYHAGRLLDAKGGVVRAQKEHYEILRDRHEIQTTVDDLMRALYGRDRDQWPTVEEASKEDFTPA